MVALRRRKFWIVWLMAVGVIANVVAAATCCWAQGHQTLGDLQDLLGPAIICTAKGPVAAADLDGSDQPPAATHQHCTMCILVAAASLALLTLLVVGVLQPLERGLRLAGRELLPPRSAFAHCGFMSRGPPLTA